MRPGGLFSFGRALIAVTLLAGALRFLRLGQVPVSLYCDEAFNAYQAWSLLLTGRDTRGVWMPLFFDIFGKGWGEPLYFYLTVPSVAIMGLTPFAARATAALAGTIAVAATGLMTRALLSDATSRRTAGVAGIAAAASMAVSPWAHHFSRIGFQASLMPALLAAGFWMARGGLGGSARRRTTRLVLGSLTLGLSLYSYAVSRLALPLLLAGFIVLYRDKVRRRAGAAGVAAAIVILMAAPMAWFSLSPAGQQRFSDVSIVNAPELDGAGPAAVAARVAAHYVSYFSPAFMLAEGDPNPRHSVPGHGAIHPHEVILLILGVAGALVLRGPGPSFILWWIAVAPIAASLTIDPRHAVRAIPMLPGLHAAIGLGAAILVHGATRTPAGARRAIAFGILVVMVAAALAITGGYLTDYHLMWPVVSGEAWQYGLKEAYAWVDDHLEAHDSVYVTRNEDYPWIHLIFHRGMNPREFQRDGLSGTPYLFDQEVFYRGDAVPGRRNPVFILKPWEVDPRLTRQHVVRYPDGKEALVIAW